MKALTIGSLFSGIGGIELGLEMTGGFRTVWQCEINNFARGVLARHWPDALRFTDVRHVNRTTVPRVDVLTGGFPCQPHSFAGKRQASADERDLWSEFARIIGELEPRWVLAENVPGLLSSRDPALGRDYPGAFFGRVLGDLARLGYDAEWHRVSAASVGAHHLRNRVFLLAYPHGDGEQQPRGPVLQERGWAGDGSEALDHAQGERAMPAEQSGQRDGAQQGREVLAHAEQREGQHGHDPHAQRGWAQQAEQAGLGGSDVAHPDRPGRQEQHPAALAAGAGECDRSGAPITLPDWAGGGWEQPHPLARHPQRGFRGVADGLPSRVDRLKALGNAVVPQCVVPFGRAILTAEGWQA